MELNLKGSKLEAYIDLYKQSKNKHVLQKLIGNYGERVLLSIGDEELDLYINILLFQNRYDLLYSLDKVDLLRKVYNRIIYAFYNHNNTSYNQQVLLFLETYNFSFGVNRFIQKENKLFLKEMLSTRKIIDTSNEFDEEELDWGDDIIRAIHNNYNIDFDLCLSIAEIKSDFYSIIIGKLFYLKPIRKLFDIIYEIDNIKNHVDNLSEVSSVKINSESIISEGITELMATNEYRDNIFNLILTVAKENTFMVNKFKDTYRKFFYEFIVNSNIDSLKKRFENEYEDTGIFPLDLIINNIKEKNLDGIIYTVLYGNHIKEKLNTFLYYDKEGIGDYIDTILNVFDFLIVQEILPDYFLDVDRFVDEISSAEEIAKNNESFNINDFMNEESMWED